MVFHGAHRRLILQNPDDRETFLSAGLLSDDRIHIIAGSGVNTERFIPKQYQSDDFGKIKKVVFAARLLWDKGLAEFIEAANKLHGEGIKAEFLIAGDPDPGNPASVPDEVLVQWTKLPSVRLLGHIDDMVAFMADADIMVLPSYREGLPRSLIEAAAAGLPIVTTDTPGCREVVEDGINGFLVPARDGLALAEALGKILKDPALAAQMGAAGRAKALAEFDEKIVFKQTVDVYKEFDFQR